MATDRVTVQHWQTFADFTRPADADAYAAGDVITGDTAAPIIFHQCAGDNGQGGVIESVTIIQSVAVATKLNADLFIFNETLTPDDDNAAFTPTDAEMLTLVGYVKCDGTVAANVIIGSGNVAIQIGGLKLPFACTRTDRALYGVLVARNAYAATSAEVFRIKLGVQQS